MSTINEQAENLARMSNNEREQFVESLVNTYPNLAETVMSNIGFALMDKDIGGKFYAANTESLVKQGDIEYVYPGGDCQV